MQVSPKEVYFLISITTVIFLIAPLFLILYVNLYNRRKKKHAEERIQMQRAFENELLKSQMEVQEQTLKTIAYDLHDNIGQLLGLTIITLSSINLADPVKAAGRITEAETLAKRAVKEVRALSKLLQGEELLSRGLLAAIIFEIEWLERSEIFKITYNSNISEIFPKPDKETIIFRLFQEVLNNIIRHAQASEILIDITFTENILNVSVTDNGIGFNLSEIMKQQKGMGLQNIQTRIYMIGGNAIINTTPGTGTAIKFIIPY
jgi:signal transduction histidine kinase